MLEQFSSTTFIDRLPSGDVIEVGDASSGTFKPHLYLPRWNKESGIALEFPLAGTLSPEIKGNVLEVTKGDFKLRWYSVQDELGGYEFEIILGKKPPVNYLDLDFQTKNVKAYYQPALTAQEVAQGVDRPENIVDSLALYHPTKRNGIYRAGKIGHLYRPLATDSLGRKQWGALSIVSGKLRVWFDPIWLASASYPVTIDPTFGYTTIGGTGYNTENSIRGGNATGATGTATTITAALKETGAANTHLVKAALYLQSDSSLLSTTNQRQDIAYIATAWYDFTLSPSVSISAVGYIPVAWANGGTGDLRIYGDAGTASLWTDAETYGTFPNPAILVETTSVDLSIYVTYTVGGLQELTASPVAIASSIQNGSISGSGIANLSGVAKSVASSVVTALLAGSGSALLASSPAQVVSSVVNGVVSNVSAEQELIASILQVSSGVLTGAIKKQLVAPDGKNVKAYDPSSDGIWY